MSANHPDPTARTCALSRHGRGASAAGRAAARYGIEPLQKVAAGALP